MNDSQIKNTQPINETPCLKLYQKTDRNQTIAESCVEIDLQYDVWFGIAVATCTLIVIIGTILNTSVIYFANKTSLTGKLRHLNKVVIHLAVSDLLYGLLGCPSLLVDFRLSKF